MREGTTKNPKLCVNIQIEGEITYIQVTITSPTIKWWDKVSAVYDEILKTFCFRKRSLERYR